MAVGELDEKDRELILAFYRRLGLNPGGFDRMSLAAAAAFADRIRAALDRG